jgi:hypothetical protein
VPRIPAVHTFSLIPDVAKRAWVPRISPRPYAETWPFVDLQVEQDWLGRMFEEELARGAGESRQQLDQIARRAFESVPPGRQQIEGEGHGSKQVRPQPLRVDERADLPVGSLAPGGMAISGVRKLPPPLPAASAMRLPSLRRMPSSLR